MFVVAPTIMDFGRIVYRIFLEGKEKIMDLQPDFERFRKTVYHQEADRVPLCEALWAMVL